MYILLAYLMARSHTSVSFKTAKTRRKVDSPGVSKCLILWQLNTANHECEA